MYEVECMISLLTILFIESREITIGFIIFLTGKIPQLKFPADEFVYSKKEDLLYKAKYYN